MPSLSTWAGLQYDADNFSGRIAFSTHLLAGFDVDGLLGVSDTRLGPAADAGLAYLILTQSVFGLIILWGYLSMGSRRDTLVLRFATTGQLPAGSRS